jgi:hypothetical protein
MTPPVSRPDESCGTSSTQQFFLCLLPPPKRRENLLPPAPTNAAQPTGHNHSTFFLTHLAFSPPPIYMLSWATDMRFPTRPHPTPPPWPTTTTPSPRRRRCRRLAAPTSSSTRGGRQTTPIPSLPATSPNLHFAIPRARPHLYCT